MFTQFSEVLDWLYSRLPVFQHSGASAYKPDLNNTKKLLDTLGNPHKKLTFVHIAGTNGKGTVSYALSAILSVSGLKTGLYTSPHLVSFTERIKINGIEISEDWVIHFCNQQKKQVEEIQPSFFEFTFAMAMQYFFENQVDIAIIEVGMGGRLDSTNIIHPILSIITNISMDHTLFLGDTLEAIAGEKAGIIKKQTPVLIGEKQVEIQAVFEKKAIEMDTKIQYAADVIPIHFTETTLFSNQGYFISEGKNITFESDLGGHYQKKNIQTIIAASYILQKKINSITENQILKGISQVKELSHFRGRVDKIQEEPLTFLDVAHNEAGIQSLLENIQNHTGTLRIVFGMVGDKDAKKILSLLPKQAVYYWVEPSVFRKKPVEKLAEEAKKYGLLGKISPDVKKGIESARADAQKEDWIVITGSCFVVADALS